MWKDVPMWQSGARAVRKMPLTLCVLVLVTTAGTPRPVFATGLAPRRSNSRGHLIARAPGSQLWLQRFNGTGNLDDVGKSVAVSPDGSRVFVGGYTYRATTEDDYATFAYEASTGTELWESFYDYA